MWKDQSARTTRHNSTGSRKNPTTQNVQVTSNRSPQRRSPQRKRRSPQRKSRSPQRKSRSPQRQSRSRQRKSRSPQRKSRSPQQRKRSNKYKLVVKDSKFDEGLFADQDIKHQRLQRDRAVVIDFVAASTSPKGWTERLDQLNLQTYDDSGFRWYDKIYYDPTFTSEESKPMWYRLNHSFYPNVELIKTQSMVGWRTLRDIHKGDELTFHYGDPDPRWDVNL